MTNKIFVSLYFVITLMVICLAGLYFVPESPLEEVKPVIEKSQYKFITIESGDLVPTQEYLDLQKRIADYKLDHFKKPKPEPIKIGTYTLVVKE